MELIKYREVLLGGDILQVPLVTHNCDMVLRYHKIIRHLIVGSYCRYQRFGGDDFISKL